MKHIVSDSNKITLNTIDIKDVLNTSCQLKNGKAFVPVKATIKMVKDTAKFIAYPIICFFNFSVTNGFFPDIWKTTSVMPDS